MHIHILGICGTFMGGLALLARKLGHRVTGSDSGVYPPMSTQLAEQGVEMFEGWSPAHLEPAPELVIVGNALSRGNPELEAVLDRGLPYTSGPQWLAEAVLYRDRWVLAVAGTHGKTTTASLLAWILETAGLKPGFLIGGVPTNLGVSARLGAAPFFVVEADEYDTAFFDKRPKFLHYRPRTLVLNNLEYDHADIFADLAAIQQQFAYLLRTVPPSGLILSNAGDPRLAAVTQAGCWSELEYFGDMEEAPAGEPGPWRARPLVADCSRFQVLRDGQACGEARWSLIGRHNMQNALAALAAARHAGVPLATGLEAVAGFSGVRRRLELRGQMDGVAVYDDFAHHPTAIAATLQALRARVGEAHITAVVEPRSNSMRAGVHRQGLSKAFHGADQVWLFRPEDLAWDLDALARELPGGARVCDDIDTLADRLAAALPRPAHVVFMSNGGFGGLPGKLLQRLQAGAGD